MDVVRADGVVVRRQGHAGRERGEDEREADDGLQDLVVVLPQCRANGHGPEEEGETNHF